MKVFHDVKAHDVLQWRMTLHCNYHDTLKSGSNIQTLTFNIQIQSRVNNNQNISWGETKSIMCDTAAEVLSFQTKNKGQMIENNP